MSKIRQALEYERKLAEAQVKSHVEITDLQISSGRELLSQAIAYERRITDQQFLEVASSQKDHQRFHEREHILYDDAIDKASSALKARLDVLESEIDRLREQSTRFVSSDRFEREHSTLIDRVDTQTAMLNEKVSSEEKVTVRQSAQQEVIDKLSANNRWLIGLAVTSGLSLLALVLHLAGAY